MTDTSEMVRTERRTTLVEGARPRLFVASALMLFVELVLIRWSGEQVVHLSFFSNFVLIASFLGIGLGFLLVDRATLLARWAPVLLATYAILLRAFPVTIDRSGEELIYFTVVTTEGPPPWVALPVILVLVTVVMTAFGAMVAREFAKLETLAAYRLDIAGSLAGIVAFSLLSWVHATPLVWALVTAALIGLLVDRRGLVVAIAGCTALVIVLGVDTFDERRSWSPYYRVDANPTTTEDGEPLVGVSVNGIPHQVIVSTDVRLENEPIYAAPYDVDLPDDPDVLVIGAGNGADVAVALRNGAGSVDAVEIDPVLLDLGRRLHPDQPYSDPRVDVHLTDGRAFLEQTEQEWDLILFALPDSLTLLQGQSALRLESYLFTVEAVEEARESLRPGGVLALYNFYREDWLVSRFSTTMSTVFDRGVCVDTSGGLSMLLVARDTDLCPEGSGPQHDVEPVVDDRPFPYLRGRTLPPAHLAVGLLVLLVAAVSVRTVAGRLRTLAPYGDLFLMGVAFLLLETRAVVQFALLFGTTWSVNAFVFAGVLVAVLVAIEVTERWSRASWRPPRWSLYAALVVALVVATLFPLELLLGLPGPLRLLTGALVSFAPILIANVLFADRFRDTASSTTAFGANLLGAVVGGVLEYTSAVVGFRTLGLIAALVYVAALVAERRITGGTRLIGAGVNR